MQEANRKRLAGYYEDGLRDASKVSKMSGIPLRTVYRVFARLRDGKSVERRAGSQRPSKLMPNDERRLYQLARCYPKYSSARIGNLAYKYGTASIDRSTVWRHLKAKGFMKLVPRKIPMLTDRHKAARLDWCEKYRGFDWSKVVFTDETYFQFYRTTLPEWCKKRPVKRAPQRGPTLMAWGGISARGCTPLAAAKKSVTAEVYQEILDECLIETMSTLYPDGYYLQQDNARPHTAETTRTYLENNGISVISWPACSPDLNPIENLWKLMKDDVEAIEPSNVQSWIDKICDFWNRKAMNYTESLINSMPRRIELCIAAHGGKIKY